MAQRTRSWPAKWVREESFWKDITTRTLSALIVLSLGYIYAVFAGYIGEPNIPRVWGTVAAGAGVLAYLYLIVRLTIWARREPGRAAGLTPLYFFGSTFVMAAAVAAIHALWW